MMEFAAIATVGDVMRLQNENRILVRLGLRQIARTKSLGLKALVEACHAAQGMFAVTLRRR